MKKTLFRDFNNRKVIDQAHIGYLFKKNIKILRSKERVVLLFFQLKVFEEFIEEFELIPECLCIVKKYAKEEMFMHIHRNVSVDTFLEGGLTPSRGFLGRGIYAIHEDEFLNDTLVYEQYRVGTTRGDVLLLTTHVIFRYTGPYVECLFGGNKKGILNLLDGVVCKEDILAIFGEDIQVFA